MMMISPAEVAAGKLPAGAAGVHWTDTNWTECAATLRDPGWVPGPLQEPGERTGKVRLPPLGTCDCHLSMDDRVLLNRKGYL